MCALAISTLHSLFVVETSFAAASRQPAIATPFYLHITLQIPMALMLAEI